MIPYYGVYQYDVMSSKAPPGAEIQDAGVFIDANTGELRDHWLLSKSPRHHHYVMAGRVAHGNVLGTADENPDLPLGYYHHRALRHGRHHLVEEA